MRIALVQLRITDAESPDERRARVLDLIGGLAGRADLVILPELWLTGAFATAAAIEYAEPLAGPTWAALAGAAADAGVHLLAGSLSEVADGAGPSTTGGSTDLADAAVPTPAAGAGPTPAPTAGPAPTAATGDAVPAGRIPAPTADADPTAPTAPRPYNTAVLFGPDGSRHAGYRKIHLFGFDGGEADAFAAGPVDPVVWHSPWGRFGLATCYDLRFPELFRALVDAGAEGFLVPTGWPAKRIDRWDVLAQARAIENQAWFIGVNAVGTHAGAAMGGRSIVVDPMGDIRYRGSDEAEEVAMVDVDTAVAADWRHRFPALRDRRIAPPRR